MTDEAKALVNKLRDENSYYRIQEKHWCIDAEELERQRLAAADRIAEQAAELAKWKALAETLARELQQIEVDAMEYYNEWRETGCDQKDAIRFAFGLGEETRKALRQYKEARDA